MSCADDTDTLRASLGACFEHDRESDTVRITSAEGTEIEVAGPDLRECLDWLVRGHGSPARGPYGELLDRARVRLLDLEARVRSEDAAARVELDTLLARASHERLAAVAADERLRTYSLARRALDQSRQVIPHDPSLAKELAELGRCIAGALNPQAYGTSQVRDLQACAEAVYANALRVLGDLRAAAAAFCAAREYQELGSGDPTTAVEIDDLETSLRRSLRDFPAALELSQRVIETNLELNQTDAAAQALQQRSIILDEMGEVEAAIEVLQTASILAESSSNEMLAMTIRHSLGICLARSGRATEAARQMRENTPLYRRLSSPKLDGCRLWLEGLIALGSDDLAAAADSLSRSRAVFEAHGFPYDTAQVSLDLAAALAGLGRATEVRDLAAATYAFMESREVHPDALAALAVFRQAAAREELTRELLHGLAQRLSRASALAPPAAS